MSTNKLMKVTIVIIICKFSILITSKETINSNIMEKNIQECTLCGDILEKFICYCCWLAFLLIHKPVQRLPLAPQKSGVPPQQFPYPF